MKTGLLQVNKNPHRENKIYPFFFQVHDIRTRFTSYDSSIDEEMFEKKIHLSLMQEIKIK
jgi:hypothetical protein